MLHLPSRILSRGIMQKSHFGTDPPRASSSQANKRNSPRQAGQAKAMGLRGFSENMNTLSPEGIRPFLTGAALFAFKEEIWKV